MRVFFLALTLLMVLSCGRKNSFFDRPMVIAETGDGYMTVSLPGQNKIRLGHPDGLQDYLLVERRHQQEVYLPALFVPRQKMIPKNFPGLAYLFLESATEEDFKQICRLRVGRATIVAFPRGKIPKMQHCRILGISGDRYLDLLLDPEPKEPVIFFFSAGVSFSA